MKRGLFLFFILINLGFSRQADTYSGTYVFYVEAKKGEIIDYQLQLNADHTFLFSSYVNNNTNEYRQKGKGNWKVENNIILFTTETSDLDENHTLNFTGTTARIIKKSPRDKSDKVIPTALQFYKSEIRIIAGLKLLLKE